MSPRVIQLPLSGGDRRHYVRELRGVDTRTDELAAYLARPDDEQDIAELAKLLEQDKAPQATCDPA